MIDLYRSLSERSDVSVHLFVKSAVQAEKPWGNDTGDIATTVLDWANLTLLARIKWLQRAANIDADCWLLGDSMWDWDNAMLSYLARRKGVRTVFLAERICWIPYRHLAAPSWFDRRVVPLVKRCCSRIVLRRYSAIGAMGRWGAEQYAELCSPTPVFPTRYVSVRHGHEQIQRPRHDSTDSLRFGYCGRLIEAKGIASLCERVFPLLKTRSDWSLMLVGDGPMRQTLEMLTRQHGVADRVTIHGFIHPADLVEKFWSRIDCLVFPSMYDGWGMVVPEALSAGVPVIATPEIGAAQQYVRQGWNGWIGSVDDMASHMTWLLDNRSALAALSKNARCSVAGDTPHNIADEFVRDLGQIIASPLE